MKIKIDEIGLKIKITDGKVKAIIGLDFGEFVVKGFRIQVSEHENENGEKLWLTPPSYKGPYKWHPIFFMPDKELWKELEKKIYQEYHVQMKEYQKKIYEDDSKPKITRGIKSEDREIEDPLGGKW